MGGHSFVMDHPAAFIERYRNWSYAMRDAFRDLSCEKDYRYWFDPFWIRAQPYRLSVKRGETADFQLHVRNFESRARNHRIEVHMPRDFIAEPAVIEPRIAGRQRQTFPFKITTRAGASEGAHLIAFDVTIDGRRYGERFDAIIEVK
jgi:hypothetical protein